MADLRPEYLKPVGTPEAAPSTPTPEAPAVPIQPAPEVPVAPAVPDTAIPSVPNAPAFLPPAPDASPRPDVDPNTVVVPEAIVEDPAAYLEAELDKSNQPSEMEDAFIRTMELPPSDS